MGRTEWRQLLYALAWGLVAFAIAGIAYCGIATAHDHLADAELKAWVKGLKNEKGEGCCDTADGDPAEAEWDTQSNSYRVRIEGQWYVVPDWAVIKTPNKMGYAMVWWWHTWSYDISTPQIRCFIAGSGT